jgi:RNA polymerase sigma-70 factor (ECF subfamily)
MLDDTPTPEASPEASDEALMARYAAGDEGAFLALFERYAASLTKMLQRRGSHPEDARELVQRTFLHLHRARASYEAGRRFRPWLITIAFNLRRDEARRAWRWRELPVEAEVTPAPVEPDPCVRAEEVQRVRQALERLAPPQRQLLTMHWLEEQSYAEIAARLGASPSAIKLRAFRAHAALRQVLSAAA